MSGIMKEEVAFRDGLRNPAPPPSEIGRKVMAGCSCVRGYGRPIRCFEKYWDDISSFEVNEEVN